MKRLRTMPCREQSDSAKSDPTRSVWASVDAVAVLALASALLFVFPGTGSAQREEMSPAACRNIQAPRHDKASLTPAQRKISSDLLLNLRAERCKSAGNAVPELRTGVEVDEKGTTVVDIGADVTEQLRGRMERLCGTVISSFPRYQSIRARIPIERLEELAESPDVRSIRSAEKYQLHEPDFSSDKKGQTR